MLWIFVIAIMMPINIGLCKNVSDSNATMTINLTEITWDHAVNRKAKLDEALKNNVKMIEADVTMGNIFNETNHIPIMAHYPNEIESDLSLAEFIKTVNENNIHKKGIKLDFKSIEAFTNAMDLLQTNLGEYEVWLNADILNGPVESKARPVNANQFLNMAKMLTKCTLSIGWTTRLEPGITGKYTDDNIKEMIQTLELLKDSMQPVTFPVRAGLVANSLIEMKKLLEARNGATLTVWSSPTDEVNVLELRKLIMEIGTDKVYLDVPKELSDKLNLSFDDKSNKSSTIKATHFAILSVIMIIFMKLF